jgi:ABC-2 type transport system permease protein
VARLFIQLKLRLVVNALRSSGGAKASFIVSSVFALLVAIGTFAALASLRHNGAAVDLTATLYTSFAFGWLVLPLIAFGLDATLDPATLAMYPLRTRPLMIALLAASATGAWPLANLIGELGITVGLAHGALAVVIAIIAALLQVLFCITLARCVTTALAGLMRSRRGRDLAALAVIPIFALYETFAQVLPKAIGKHELTAASFAGVDAWLRWLPPGLAAHAVADASTGHAGTAVLRLLIIVAVIVVLGILWARALGHALVTADTSTQAASVKAGALAFGRRPGVFGTLAARSLIYQRRDPGSLISWGISLVIMVVVAIGSLRGQQNPQVGVMLSAGFGGAFVWFLRGNLFGITGPAFYLEALALSGRRALRSWFAGQNAAVAVISVPLVLVVPLVLAVISGHPFYGVLAMAIGLSATGAGLGISNVFSAALPYPMQRRVGSPTPRQVEGYAVQAIIGRLGSLIIVGILEVPVIIAIATTGSVGDAIRLPALIGGGAVYGALLAWTGIATGASIAEGKLPELFQLAAQTKL